MSYRLIEGEVRLYYQGQRHVGSRPDGDSVWFRPDNPSLLDDVTGRSAEFNQGGFAQLRFEGIDALELHFPGSDHQLEHPTVAARDFLLNELGFEEIDYAPSEHIDSSVRDSAPIVVRGSILTRTIDPFGRPVSFIFAGNAPERSGSDIFLDVDRMDQSLNAALLRQGHVYPAFYSARNQEGERVGGLPGDLRDHLTELSNLAFSRGDGLWQDDQSTSGATVTQHEDLFELAIWPKLYRRMAKFYRDETADHSTLHGFIDWLHEDRNSRDDLMLVLSIGELLNFSDILTVASNTIQMNFEPEDLVIVPR